VTDELTTLDATAQADLVRRGDVAPIELVDAAIARIECLNPQLNAVITTRFERARAEAKADLPTGPLRGVPFLLKDLGAQSAGDPSHGGMRALRDAGWIAPRDTFLAAKFRAAGLVFLGKTNTPELGLLPTTEPESYGPTRNPWDPSRSPGGSSGGAAAAVASGMVPIAHATDGGGSIRIPASQCGLVGLKVSRGRVSFGPDASERWGGFSVENTVSRSVRDTATMLDAIRGEMPGDAYTAPPPVRPYREEVGAEPGPLRIGLLTSAPNGMAVHRDCVIAAERAAKLLGSLGHVVEPSFPAALADPELVRATVAIIAAATAAALDAWSEKLGRPLGEGDVEPLTWAVAELGRRQTATDFLRARQCAHSCARRIAAWWADGFDLLLTPTEAEPPPPLGSFKPEPGNPLAGFVRAAPFSTFTSAFNVTGQPAISLPLHWNEAGLPIGVQLVAAYGREDLLLRVAAQLEQAQPWTHRLPAVHA
jgi:amidase